MVKVQFLWQFYLSNIKNFYFLIAIVCGEYYKFYWLFV